MNAVLAVASISSTVFIKKSDTMFYGDDYRLFAGGFISRCCRRHVYLPRYLHLLLFAHATAAMLPRHIIYHIPCPPDARRAIIYVRARAILRRFAACYTPSPFAFLLRLYITTILSPMIFSRHYAAPHAMLASSLPLLHHLRCLFVACAAAHTIHAA